MTAHPTSDESVQSTISDGPRICDGSHRLARERGTHSIGLARRGTAALLAHSSKHEHGHDVCYQDAVSWYGMAWSVCERDQGL